MTASYACRDWLRIIGVDPGFARFGVAALSFNGERVRLDAWGVLRTDKENKKAHVLATEDNLRRAREIVDLLDDLVTTLDHSIGGQTVAFAAESMSWPRNAAVTAKMGIVWGVLATVARYRKIPIFQASPQAVKKDMTQRKDASKKEVEHAVKQRIHEVAMPVFLCNRGIEKRPTREELNRSSHPWPATVPGILERLDASLGKTLVEHPYDAAAVALTCSKAEGFQMARRSSQ